MTNCNQRGNIGMPRTRSRKTRTLRVRRSGRNDYGFLMSSARAWRIVGILASHGRNRFYLLANVSEHSIKLVPYIVEVDKLGTSVTAGVPTGNRICRSPCLRATLGRFITSLPVDHTRCRGQKQYNRLGTYANCLRTSGSIDAKINAWFRGAIHRSRKRKPRLFGHRGQHIVALSKPGTSRSTGPEYERDRKRQETGRAAASAGIANGYAGPPFLRTRRDHSALQSDRRYCSGF